MRGIDSRVILYPRYTLHSKARDNCTLGPSCHIVHCGIEAIITYKVQNAGAYGAAFAQLFAVRENYNVFTLVKEFTTCKEILWFIYACSGCQILIRVKHQIWKLVRVEFPNEQTSYRNTRGNSSKLYFALRLAYEFLPRTFWSPEKIYFPWRRSVFCGNNRTDESHRITNRDTFLTELRLRFTTHLLRRFRTGTPLLEKFVNNESSCVSTIARPGYIDGPNEAIKSTSRSTCQFLDAVHVTVVFVMNGSASARTGVLLVLTDP